MAPSNNEDRPKSSAFDYPNCDSHCENCQQPYDICPRLFFFSNDFLNQDGTPVSPEKPNRLFGLLNNIRRKFVESGREGHNFLSKN